jgi:hypothetical protein
MDFGRPQFSRSSLRRYLLGLSSETECAKIEEAFLKDELPDQSLSLEEDELIEDYVDGLLQPAYVKHFDDFFLNNSERRTRLLLISSLRKNSPDLNSDLPALPNSQNVNATSRSQLARPSITLVGVVLISLVVFLGNRVISLERQLNAAKAQRTLALNEQNASASASAPSEASESIHLRLVPDGTRGNGSMNRLRLIAAARTAVLEVPTQSAPFDDYRVSLRTPDDEEVWSESQLRVDKQAYVSVLIGVQSLPVGDYEVRLAGKSSHNRYQEILSCPLRLSR